MNPLRSGESWWKSPQASLQRAALWNPYFYRFFGSEHGHVQSGLRPLSGDESCRALSQVVELSGGQHPRPTMLKRCLSRMWSSGYRPSNQDYDSMFKGLASKAVPHAATPDEAFKALLQDGDHNPSRAVRPQPEQADAMVAEARVSRDSEPTAVTFDGNVWTVKKEFLVHSPIKGVIGLLNPVNWQLLTPFFKKTQRIDPPQNPTGPTEPWSGVLHEEVVINWNTVAVQSFDALLKIDYTVARDMARADYSLKYEKDNQIVVDDGYAEARREASQATRYIGYKRLRFASSFLNLVAPALLCMFIEQDEVGFRDLLEREADAIAPHVSAANETVKAPKK
jgi:hypothetical protein